jgi:hypothetical protein
MALDSAWKSFQKHLDFSFYFNLLAYSIKNFLETYLWIWVYINRFQILLGTILGPLGDFCHHQGPLDLEIKELIYFK